MDVADCDSDGRAPVAEEDAPASLGPLGLLGPATSWSNSKQCSVFMNEGGWVYKPGAPGQKQFNTYLPINSSGILGQEVGPLHLVSARLAASVLLGHVLSDFVHKFQAWVLKFVSLAIIASYILQAPICFRSLEARVRHAKGAWFQPYLQYLSRNQ